MFDVIVIQIECFFDESTQANDSFMDFLIIIHTIAIVLISFSFSLNVNCCYISPLQRNASAPMYHVATSHLMCFPFDIFM